MYKLSEAADPSLFRLLSCAEKVCGLQPKKCSRVVRTRPDSDDARGFLLVAKLKEVIDVVAPTRENVGLTSYDINNRMNMD